MPYADRVEGGILTVAYDGEWEIGGTLLNSGLSHGVIAPAAYERLLGRVKALVDHHRRVEQHPKAVA